MEPQRTKQTKQTPKPGEVKQVNAELLRSMINASNNSILTSQMAKKLSQKLEKEEIAQLLEWFRHANRQISNKLSSGRRF